MANISAYLKKIKEAIYGEEVRGAIHDSIEKINEDVEETSSSLDKKADKTEIPTKVSELDNDLKFVVDGTKPYFDKYGLVKTNNNFGIDRDGNGVLYTIAATEEEIKNPNSNTGYKVITPNNLDTAVKSVGDGYYALGEDVTELEERITIAEKIAKSASKAMIFEDYADLINYFTSNGTEINNGIPPAIDMTDPDSEYYLPIGTNIYIKDLDVPDLWVMGHTDTYKDLRISYYGDINKLMNVLKEQGRFDIGYLRLAALETQKVDLSVYYNKTQIDDRFASVQYSAYLSNSILHPNQSDDTVGYPSIKAIKEYCQRKTVFSAFNETNGYFDVRISSESNYYEFRYGERESLTVWCGTPTGLPDDYIMSVVFSSGETPTVYKAIGGFYGNPNPPEADIYMQGTDCSDGVFTPTANNRYTIIFSYDGEILSGIVNGIPKAVSA